MNTQSIVGGPSLRQAAIITLIGYLLGSAVPFISFSALPSLLAPSSAAQTTQNVLAHQGLFVFCIFGMLVNFIGDVVAAWGLSLLLRPANAALATIVAWFRVIYATIGIAALLNLATAYRLLIAPDSLAVFGRDRLEAQVQFALVAFSTQSAFGLMVFGLHLLGLGWLIYRSGYIPRWLGAVLATSGMGWIVLEANPYVLPQVDLGFVEITSIGELFLLGWLIGWGTRLRGTTAAVRTLV
jgi:uncharacterized protein DUF4386